MHSSEGRGRLKSLLLTRCSKLQGSPFLKVEKNNENNRFPSQEDFLRKIKRHMPLLLGTFFLFQGETSAQHSKETMNIAVSDFIGNNVDIGTASIISERLRIELFKTRQFTVLERNQMEEILKEQGFQQSGCVTEQCYIEVGQLLGVTHMIIGSVGKLGQTFTINAKMIDVRDGRIIQATNSDCKCDIDEVLSVSTFEIAKQLCAEGSIPEQADKNRGHSFNVPSMGLQVRDLNDSDIQKLNFPKGIKGVLVIDKDPDRETSTSGIEINDAIVQIGLQGKGLIHIYSFQGVEALLSQVKTDEEILLHVKRGTKSHFINTKLKKQSN
ncbi:MAG: hypothetical protein GF398_20875 [Chitinivibrionales bacterium]|nr:hypothetical protein [Chitinivibrionales bacterium]